MLDFLRKELIDQFDWSNIGYDLSTEKRVLVNDREHILVGYAPCAAAVVNIWKVPVSSSKQFKYAVHIGVAQQSIFAKDDAFNSVIELARERSYIEPSITMMFNKEEEARNIVSDLLENVIPLFAEILAGDKILLNDVEISKIFNDRYSQKYPADIHYFRVIPSAV